MTKTRKNHSPVRPRRRNLVPKHTNESYSAQKQHMRDLAAENNLSQVFISNADDVSIGRSGASTSQQIQINSTSEPANGSHPPHVNPQDIFQTAQAPMQPCQANTGMCGHQPTRPPPPYTAAPPAPMRFERPHNSMFDHAYQRNTPVSQPTPAPVQLVAPMPSERPHNAMFDQVQMRYTHPSVPTPAPVQLVAPMVVMPASGQEANASQVSTGPQTGRPWAMYQPTNGPVALRPQYVYPKVPHQQAYGALPPPQFTPMMNPPPYYFAPPPAPVTFVGQPNDMLNGVQAPQVPEPTPAPVKPAAPTGSMSAVEQILETTYQRLSRRWDEEAARGRAQVEADTQRLQERHDQVTAERTQQAASAPTRKRRRIEDHVIEHTGDQGPFPLPIRSAAPNVVGYGGEISMAPDAGHRMPPTAPDVIPRRKERPMPPDADSGTPPAARGVHEGYEHMVPVVEPETRGMAEQLLAMKNVPAVQHAGQEPQYTSE